MEKKFFSYGAPTTNAPLWIFVSYNLPRIDQAGVSLSFDHVLVREDLYQICCFIQNLHYDCAYTPGQEAYFIKHETFSLDHVREIL